MSQQLENNAILLAKESEDQTIIYWNNRISTAISQPVVPWSLLLSESDAIPSKTTVFEKIMVFSDTNQ